MASFTETFTQADGTLGSPWFDDGTDLPIEVRSNIATTVANTASYVGLVFHGLTVTGDWQIDFDLTAPLIVGDGGMEFGLRSSVDGSGYGGFIGNAFHIYAYDHVGGHTTLTNDSRPGEGSSGVRSDHCTLTRRGSDGFMETFLNGVHMGNNTDTNFVAGDLFFFSLRNATSPTNETSMDNLVIKDSIGVAGPTTTAAVNRRRRRQLTARGLYVR